MPRDKFERLVREGLLSSDALGTAISEAQSSKLRLEDILLKAGIPRHKILSCLAEFYACDFVEYDEKITASRDVLRLVDPVSLKAGLWMPLAVRDTIAEVIACNPQDTALAEKIRVILGVEAIEFKVGLPGDIVRIIENNFDLNVDFPPTAGRTPLAKVRTYLAERRSLLAEQRTALARGRTGLAFLRTGIAFIAITATLTQVFGVGYLSPIEILLLIVGIDAVFDGFKWYLPVRKEARRILDYSIGEGRGGFTALEIANAGVESVFSRSESVEHAEELRAGWSKLSPVERRRFLANDRTDMAEERTFLASLRTKMAKSRTGLAFARTGVVFTGLGLALIRQFHTSGWTIFDVVLVVIGALMTLEGILEYFPGRKAGTTGLKAILKAELKKNIWNSAFPPFYKADRLHLPPVKASHAPGVWSTTGLALERTLLAERRNVMARLRLIMAISRTGMAFIRTGLSVSAVGAGMLIYFGASSIEWTVFDLALIIAGLVLIIDGINWHMPAERTKRQFPYSYGDVEISMPDYSMPGRDWKKAVFSHDDI